MNLTRIMRRAALGVSAVAVTGALAVSTMSTSAPSRDTDLATGVPGTANPPINTAKQYQWGSAVWKDEFIGELSKGWALSDPAPVIQNQYGQLTLNGPGGVTKHVLSATYTLHAKQYGRWDTSMRSKQYEFNGAPYRAVVELLPNSTADYDCGRKNILLSTFRLGAKRADAIIRNNGNRYMAYNNHPVDSNEFHTYALEITKDHISWFMEGKVIMTERRTAAFSGSTFKLRYRLIPAGNGQKTNKGRMQMDWARYYTLDRKNAKSIEAPQGTVRSFPSACDAAKR